MPSTCRMCPDPKTCTCQCMVCKWARLNLVDPAKYPSLKEFMDKWAKSL